jgi:hypothetical protein
LEIKELALKLICCEMTLGFMGGKMVSGGKLYGIISPVPKYEQASV